MTSRNIKKKEEALVVVVLSCLFKHKLRDKKLSRICIVSSTKKESIAPLVTAR